MIKMDHKTIRKPVFCMLFSYFYYYGVRTHLTNESRKETIFLGSKFKDAVDVGRRVRQMVTLHLQSGFLLVEWHHPHLGRGFSI